MFRQVLVIPDTINWGGVAHGVEELGLYERGVGRSIGGVGGVKNGRLL